MKADEPVSEDEVGGSLIHEYKDFDVVEAKQWTDKEWPELSLLAEAGDEIQLHVVAGRFDT
jgi:hypothetical protein